MEVGLHITQYTSKTPPNLWVRGLLAGSHALFYAKQNTKDLDLTFLKCTLNWNVCSVLTQQFGTPQNECSVNKRVCNRTEIMPIEQRADPVNYNWTSIVCVSSEMQNATHALAVDTGGIME
jgi:hypothetical protein